MSEQKVVNMFEPKEEKPLWFYVYDAVKDFSYGTRFTYEQLQSISGLNKNTIQTLKKKVDRELKKDHKKALINIHGYGYKIGDPNEQVAKAKDHEKKGNRQIKWAAELVENIDTESMTNEQKNKLMYYTMSLQDKLSYARKKNTQSIKETQKAQKSTQKSEELQQKGLDQIDYLMGEIQKLKDKLS